jgi:hypothetical protein
MPRQDLVLGSFTVSTDNEEVDAFAEALGLPLQPNEVPIIYSLRLLTKPSVMEAINAAIKTPAHSLFHQKQTFLIHAPLERNNVYELAVTLRTDGENPPLYELKGSISDMSGRTVMEFNTRVISKRNVVRVD